MRVVQPGSVLTEYCQMRWGELWTHKHILCRVSRAWPSNTSHSVGSQLFDRETELVWSVVVCLGMLALSSDHHHWLSQVWLLLLAGNHQFKLVLSVQFCCLSSWDQPSTYQHSLLTLSELIISKQIENRNISEPRSVIVAESLSGFTVVFDLLPIAFHWFSMFTFHIQQHHTEEMKTKLNSCLSASEKQQTWLKFLAEEWERRKPLSCDPSF